MIVVLSLYGTYNLTHSLRLHRIIIQNRNRKLFTTVSEAFCLSNNDNNNVTTAISLSSSSYLSFITREKDTIVGIFCPDNIQYTQHTNKQVLLYYYYTGILLLLRASYYQVVVAVVASCSADLFQGMILRIIIIVVVIRYFLWRNPKWDKQAGRR